MNFSHVEIIVAIALSGALGCSAQSADTAVPATAARLSDQHLTYANLAERLATMEERVLGLEHPLDSLLERTDALENEVFGAPVEVSPTGTPLTVPQRIASLEATVFKNASDQRQELPDGMSTFVSPDNRAILKRQTEEPSDRPTSEPVAAQTAPSAASAATVLPTPLFVSPYSSPGKYYGYPYIYKGPGLPPYAYGTSAKR